MIERPIRASAIVPVFNEETTVGTIVDSLLRCGLLESPEHVAALLEPIRTDRARAALGSPGGDFFFSVASALRSPIVRVVRTFVIDASGITMRLSLQVLPDPRPTSARTRRRSPDGRMANCSMRARD